MAVLPANLALANIADGASIVASDHRNNYSSVQAYTNALNTIFGAGVTGQLFSSQGGTTVSWAYPPGYEYAYIEFTANVTANTVAEAAATSVVSAGAVTFDGSTAVVVEFFCPGFALGGVSNQHGLSLWDGATDLGRLFDGTVTASASGDYPCGVLRRKVTPSAGAHTFSARIWSVAATNFLALAGAGGVGAKLPGYIRITKA